MNPIITFFNYINNTPKANVYVLPENYEYAYEELQSMDVSKFEKIDVEDIEIDYVVETNETEAGLYMIADRDYLITPR